VDEQVATLLDGAQALLTARGRSWAVLAPGLQKAGAMNGEEVLTRLLGLVREVLQARCAALAVAHQGRVLRLLQDEATPASPPAGPAHGSRGLMDRLLDDAQPLRVPSLTTHAAARGWPERHRTLGSFLGAPIRARGHTIGYLYLVEKQTPGGFTLDDEDLLLSFASTAAPTITSLGLLPDPDGAPPVAGSPTEGAAAPPALWVPRTVSRPLISAFA
jgi:GAF domain-containing protein